MENEKKNGMTKKKNKIVQFSIETAKNKSHKNGTFSRFQSDLAL